MAQKKVANKKPAAANKRNTKAKPVEEEKPKMDVEDSDSDDNEELNGINYDDGSNSEAEDAAGLVESEAEEAEDDGEGEEDDDDDDDEEDEDDDDDDQEDEIEPGEVSKVSKSVEEAEDDDDSDDEPAEEPITKQKNGAASPKKGGIPKVTVGRIPAETPKDQQLFVTRLPTDFKHLDLVALFTKFGPIAVINRIKTKAGGNNVLIAFESADAVEAVLAAKEKALTLNGQVVSVSRPHDKDELNDRTIVVGLIGSSTTKEQLSNHFKSCGAIEVINFSHNRALPTAYLRFESVSSIPKALKLNGSELNSRFITVRDEASKNKQVKSPACTILVGNTGNFESYKSDNIEKIFKKHGEIVEIDVVCTRSILCFVTYKTAEQAEKAKKQLDGKTVNDLEIKLDNFHYSSSARSILVTNLTSAVDEQQVREVFAECGEIDSIKMLPSRAIIKFTTDDAFCKSFLLNERVLQGQPMFLEPNSLLKHKIMAKKAGPKPQQKRQGIPGGAPAGGAPGKFNKFSNNNNQKWKPFNKRPAQDNSFAPKFNKKARKA